MSLSGPAALHGLRFLRSFGIPAVEIPNSSMIGLGLWVPAGAVSWSLSSVMSCSFIVHSLDSDMGPFVVKTDWNWELNRFAFCRVSVISLSSYLSGGCQPGPASCSSEKQKVFYYYRWLQSDLNQLQE